VSSPLAIGAVSAVLRNLLDNGMINALPPPPSPVKVTAVAPDTIKLDDPQAPPSLNLFLYRTSRNLGWAEAGLPTYDGNGTRLANPPLALDLHYLLTAYSSAEFQAEILLGYAMHVLHERPVLDRDAIRAALDPTSLGPTILPPAFQALTAADLADQVEAVTITDEPMDTEEMSRLWSAIQAHYRPTTAYVVSVVLIEARKPSRKPLPVLSRGPVDLTTGHDRGVVVEPSLLPPYPTIVQIEPDESQPAARLGEPVRLEGHHLSGTSLVVRFAHRLLDEPNEIPIASNTDTTGIDLTLPTGGTTAQDWPAGVYLVSVTLIRPDELDPRTTNVAAMLLAPEPQVGTAVLVRDATTRHVTATLDVVPELRPAQDATLSIAGESAAVELHPTQTATLTFELGDVPQGSRPVRLTVDGVESLLIDYETEPPEFDPSQFVTVPA
jgi:Pvc16 N-terminal domain